MHGEKVIAELKPIVDEGKCCIVFDFGFVSCDYVFYEDPRLSFSINGKTMTDCKLNHRYPNGNYITISQKRGRRVSKIGYPYVLDMENKNAKLELMLSVWETTIILPIQLSLSKEAPVCGISLHYIIDQSEHFKLWSHNPISPTGWMAKSWITEKTHDTPGQNVVILGKINDGILNKYDTAITPFPCTPDRLLLL